MSGALGLSHLSAIVEALDTGVVVKNARNEVCLINAAFVRLLNGSGIVGDASGWLGMDGTTFMSVVAASLINPELTAASWNRAWADDESRVCVVEFSSGRRARQTVRPLALPDGRGLIGEYTDITGDANILEDSDSEYRKIFEEGPLGISVIDIRDFRYVRVNDRMAEIVGYTHAELLARSFTDITHPSDRDLDNDLANQLFTSAIPYYQIDKRFLHADGSVVWGRLTATMIRDANGRPLYGMGLVEDITEHKRAEAQLRQSQKLESIGTLASGVAHELNNPIQGILTYAEVIASLPGIDEQAADFSQEIVCECERMSSIVRNLLSFSRHNSDARRPVALGELIDGTLTLVRAVLRHDGITMVIEIPPELPVVRCDDQQIRQVLMNLITNARDALNERFPQTHPDKVLALRAAQVEAPDGGWLELRVRDHGAGMSAAVRERIFDPFFTTKAAGQGTGLGLSISHTIIKEHGGELSVDSEPGRSTEFCVRLPLTPGSE